MSSPIDPHDPRLDSQRQDELSLVALGEQADPDFAAHFASCDVCQDEMFALRQTVELARAAARIPVTGGPPDSLWDGIAAAISAPESTPDDRRAEDAHQPERQPADRTALAGHTELPGADVYDAFSPRAARRCALESRRPTAPEGASLAGRARPGRRRTALLAAAAAVLVAAGAGYGIGRVHSGPRSTVTATAALAAQPGGPGAVSGTARLVRHSDEYSLTVETADLPLWQGYYAVWVFDPRANKMINVGTLDSHGRGTFSLPSGVDVRSYDVIDVSAQKFDGNNQHEQSVLCGGLTQ